MPRDDRAERDTEEHRPLAGEELSRQAIERAVLKDAIQKPLTMFPLTIAAVSSAYLALIQVHPAAFNLAWFSALIGLGSWVYNYFIRGDKLAEDYVRRLRSARDRHAQEGLGRLARECRKLGFADGAREADDLASAYGRLHEFLDARRAQGHDASAERFATLADDTFRQGTHILERALDVFRAIASVDADKLRKERERWQRELAALGGRGREAHEARREALQSSIASHERRLSSYEERAATLLQLVAEADKLEAALETAYLQLIDIVKGSGDLGSAGDGADRQLELAVEAARRVEERLRQAEAGPDGEDDDTYVKAGKARR